VYGITNDGTKSKKDYADYVASSIGSCFREYRNTPTPVWVKILYQKGKVRVDVDIRQGAKGYTTCFESSVDVPAGYYFGLSASTNVEGQDDHDIHSFETYELNPAPKGESPLRPFEKEDIAKGHEFHLTEEMKTKIQEAEHVQTEPKEPPQAMTENVVRLLEENQFHILEGIQSIQDRLEIKPLSLEHQQGFESRLDTHLRQLQYL
jgi:hypothetical protein